MKPLIGQRINKTRGNKPNFYTRAGPARRTALWSLTLALGLAAGLAGEPPRQPSIPIAGISEIPFHDGDAEIAAPDGLSVRLRDGVLYSSVNGAIWKERSLPFKTFLRGIARGHHLWVAVGGSYLDEPAVIVTSRDGIRWIRQQAPCRNNLYGVACGNGPFVAVGDAGVICTSVDGIIWKRRDAGLHTTQLASVTWGDGIFVAGGESGLILASSDGVSWKATRLNPGVWVGKLSYAGNEFIVSSCVANFTSSNGLIWQRAAARPEFIAESLR